MPLVEGRSSRDICAELYIAPNTLRTQVQNLLAKLRVHSRLEAVALALRQQLVEMATRELLS
ncbi:MAG: LuxR C-terminal-related transcriptional regulator [Candidatus Limnocylindrales bacterium]